MVRSFIVDPTKFGVVGITKWCAAVSATVINYRSMHPFRYIFLLATWITFSTVHRNAGCWFDGVGIWIVGTSRSTCHCSTTKRGLSLYLMFEMRTLIYTCDLSAKIPGGRSDSTLFAAF